MVRAALQANVMHDIVYGFAFASGARLGRTRGFSAAVAVPARFEVCKDLRTVNNKNAQA